MQQAKSFLSAAILNHTSTQFFITHLTNSIDLAMNNLCYECSEDGVFWIVPVVFLVIKKLGAQTKLKQKTDYNIQKKTITTMSCKHIFTWGGFRNEVETHSTFSKSFCLLELLSLWSSRTIIPWKQIFLNSKSIKWGNL